MAIAGGFSPVSVFGWEASSPPQPRASRQASTGGQPSPAPWGSTPNSAWSRFLTNCFEDLCRHENRLKIEFFESSPIENNFAEFVERNLHDEVAANHYFSVTYGRPRCSKQLVSNLLVNFYCPDTTRAGILGIVATRRQ
jgi:hypothetical protein